MFMNVARRIRTALVLVVAAVALGSILGAQPSIASDTGTLKLKVQRCFGTSWVSGGLVQVVITRSGVGEVDSDSGYTNSVGYVEFTFTSLESGDQAHVTVTPSGDDPDDSHVYYWVHDEERAATFWDLGIQADSTCQDGWYDEKEDIILCLYR